MDERIQLIEFLKETLRVNKLNYTICHKLELLEALEFAPSDDLIEYLVKDIELSTTPDNGLPKLHNIATYCYNEKNNN
jgi:hypothetical protein